MDSGGIPVTLPPDPPLPVHAGRVLLDQTHQEVPHAGDKIAVHFASLANLALKETLT